MPNAQAYRTAAERCRSVGRRLHDHADGLRRSASPDGVMSGPVADEMASLLDGWVHELTLASTQLDVVAMMCERRAEVCASYARAVQRYLAEPFLERITSAPPFPPAPWVEL